MVAPGANVLFHTLIVFAIFCVKKSRFVTKDGISITLNSVYVYDVTKETLTNSTLWTYLQYRHFY